MHFIYYTISFENYGLALIIFTVLTRLAMLPLTIKQYQGTAKMQKLNPKLEELRRQYGTDKKKLQEETMKLYQEEKVNPAGSCLPMLIQFPILFSLYPVITRPLRYMLGKTLEDIAKLTELFKSITGSTAAFVQEMEMLNFFKNDPASMSRAQLANLLSPGDFINMNFFGLDLSRVPTIDTNLLFGEQSAIYLPLLLIPIIGVVSTYISGRFSMASTAASQPAQNQQASSMGKSMQVIGPVMTLIFSFQLPAGVLIYWIAGYLIQIVQQLFINKYILKLDNIFGKKTVAADTGGGKRRTPIAGGQNGKAITDGQGGKQLAITDKGGAPQGARGSQGGQGSQGAQPVDGDRVTVYTDDTGDGQERLYDGGAYVNRLISAMGGTGGAGAKDTGPGGIVHGGSFRPNHKIPGITSDYDDAGGDDFDGGDGGGQGGGESGGAAPGEGDGGESGGAAQHQPQRQQQQKQAGGRNTDARSNTQKNYGSQKKRKKKK